MSQASFALLIALALCLTVYFAIGAWQSSADDRFGPASAVQYESR
jgi:hypothetical protein